MGGAVDDEAGVSVDLRCRGCRGRGRCTGIHGGIGRARGGSDGGAPALRDQHSRAEGFGDDVVRPLAEAEHSVGHFRERRDEQDVGVAVLADAPRGLEPVDTGHGWPIVGAITVIQTLSMFVKLIRRSIARLSTTPTK